MAEEQVKELQLVVFRVGDEEFGVEINRVREIVRLVQITYLPKSLPFIEGVVNLRGQVVAVIDLAKRLGISSGVRGEQSRIVVAEAEGNTVGMIVDSVSEVVRLPYKNIEEISSLMPTEISEHFIRGVGKFKDKLLVLLDLNKTLSFEDFQSIEHQIKSMIDNPDKKGEKNE